VPAELLEFGVLRDMILGVMGECRTGGDQDCRRDGTREESGFHRDVHLLRVLVLPSATYRLGEALISSQWPLNVEASVGLSVD
jgi:hypothetical protein